MEICGRRHRGLSGLGVRRKRASLGAGGFPTCSKRAGEAAAVGQRKRSGQVPGHPPGGTPGPGGAGQGGRGPAAQVARTKPARAGLATHNKKLMSAAAWAAGAAVTRPRGGRRRRWRRPGKKRQRERRGGGGERRLVGRSNLFGFATSSGRRRGRKWEALGLNHSVGRRRERRRGKGRWLEPGGQPRRGRGAATLAAASSDPRGPPAPANSRESDAHPLRPSGCGPRVPPVLDTFAAPDHAPRVRRGRQAGGGLSPPGWWVVAEPAQWLLSDRERSGLQLRDGRVLRGDVELPPEFVPLSGPGGAR